jgi:hypothetical protein
MSRPLVKNDSEVAANFHTFIKLRESKKPTERHRYDAFLRKAKILVVEKINGKREYAPSRFVGYRRNSLTAHEADTERNGTMTTPELEKIYGCKWTYDAEESERYVRFCKQHGIEKETNHLLTPLKFIFSGFYTPSAVATRSKTSAPVTTTENERASHKENNYVTTFPLNQILYGPPGTGKTFSTSALTLAILTGQSWAEVNGHYGNNHAALRQELEAYHEQGQTAFVTFHQAFGYEDFVEGIKPYEKENDQLGYRVEDGVFKRICRTARQAWQAANTGQSAPDALQLAAADFDELYERFGDDLRHRIAKGSHPQLVTSQGKPVEVIAVDADGILTLIHLSNLHGNTYKHRIAPKWIRQIYERYSSVAEIKKVYEELRQLGGTNTSLQWAIFNGLKIYEQQQSMPYAHPYSVAAPQLQATEIPRFVLIIDEINRGSVANIFGELITLLETDKRTGEATEITVTLPYSKQSFSVPSNLYLLGTMNTADRSVEALDTALRRRFSFTEMRPNAGVIRQQVGSNGVIGEGENAVDVAQILEVLNSRLEQLLDHDHCLGHALLLRIADLEDLRAAFQRNILPLLQEYFFGDWGKIGLVLGEKFITVADKTEGRHALAKFGKYDATGLRDKPLYRLTPPKDWDAKTFRSIYAPA